MVYADASPKLAAMNSMAAMATAKWRPVFIPVLLRPERGELEPMMGKPLIKPAQSCKRLIKPKIGLNITKSGKFSQIFNVRPMPF